MVMFRPILFHLNGNACPLCSTTGTEWEAEQVTNGTTNYANYTHRRSPRKLKEYYFSQSASRRGNLN